MGLSNFGAISDELVVKIRKRWLSEHYEQNKEAYDQLDVEQVINEDWIIKRFIILAYKVEDDTVSKMDEALRWRYENNMRNVKDNYFPIEFYELGVCFVYEPDRDGLPTMYVRVKYVKRFTELMDDYRKYLRHTIYKIDEATKGNGWVLVLDFTDCGLTHYESIDLLHYLISTCHYYFPAGMNYALCIDLPWVLRTFWNMVKYWIPEKRRDMVRFGTRETLTEFIPEENLIPTLGGICKKPFKEPPANSPTALEFGMGTLGLDRERTMEILDGYADLLEEARREDEISEV